MNSSNMIFKLELGKHTAPATEGGQNEDHYGFYFPQQPEVLLLRGQMFLVADGNGKAGLGAFASKLVVQTIIQEYFEEPWIGTVEEMLTKSLLKANRVLIDANRENQTGDRLTCSVTCGVVHQEHLYLAHIGTCQAYFTSNQLFEILTQSHSFNVDKPVQEVSALGEQKGSVLVRALGIDENPQIDLIKRRLQINDQVLICSDGVVKAIEEREVQGIMSSNPIQSATELLVDRARRGTPPDDATALIVKIKSIRRVDADDGTGSRSYETTEPAERQIVIKGVRYRSTWQEEQLPPITEEIADDFSQDRDMRRPVMKRKTSRLTAKPDFSWRQIFNILTIVAFVVFAVYLAIRYLPNLLQRDEGETTTTITQEDVTLKPIKEPPKSKESEISTITSPDAGEQFDVSEGDVEKATTQAVGSIRVVLIDGTFKPNINWRTLLDGMKLISSQDRISQVKSTIRLTKSKILWLRNGDPDREQLAKQRATQYQQICIQSLGITPEVSPLDLTLVLGANFKSPKLLGGTATETASAGLDYYLEILNGTPTPGLARRVSDLLDNRIIAGKRLVVVDYRNADKKNYPSSFIKCAVEQNGLAEELKSLLRQPITINNSGLYDIKLVFGADVQ
ncbi:MAG: protein phosphatase 2C domain-containing protein [candidate division KSB1 bacterium]|nr:protein phosphatase 2C domain-containing protein [candidate division KSB1 bacterium]